MLFFFCSLHGKPQRRREKSAVSKAKTCRRVNWCFIHKCLNSHVAQTRPVLHGKRIQGRTLDISSQVVTFHATTMDVFSLLPVTVFHLFLWQPPNTEPSVRVTTLAGGISAFTLPFEKLSDGNLFLLLHITLNCCMLEHEKKNDFLDSLKERSWLKQSL